jgi:hypothetical protein
MTDFGAALRPIDGVTLFVVEVGTVVGIGPEGETLVVEHCVVTFVGNLAYCTKATKERILAEIEKP